jgi:outer membrane beta-barrel protein
MRLRLFQLGIIVGFLSFFSANIVYASATSDLSTPKVIAVQTRGFDLKDEITASAGYLPLDSFNRYLSYGGSYTHYYNPYEAWEVININKAINYSTGLQSQIEQSFNISAYPFNTLDYYVTTNFVYTPFFNKSLFMNSSIIRGETALVVGTGIAKFDGGFSNEADMGAIFRFFMGPSLSLKFDIRYHFYFAANTQNNMNLSAGLSYSFGSDSAAPVKPVEKEEEND